MTFRIRPAKPFTAEFIRVGSSQLDKAIGSLTTQPDGPFSAIHAARKRFKRLRALYRLVQPDAAEFRVRENARMRDIAKTLATVRDATALVETAERLKANAASEEEIAALSFACQALTDRRQRIADAEADLPGKIAAAIETCHAVGIALHELDIADGPSRTAKRLSKVWAKQQTKAQQALARCKATHAADDFHELRKSGQTTWMHLSLLRDLWPSAMDAKRRDAKQLVDLLGEEHDLSILTQTINENPELFGDSDTLALLIGAIILRQQEIRSLALQLAEPLFRDEPRHEADIIATLWIEAAHRDR